MGKAHDRQSIERSGQAPTSGAKQDTDKPPTSRPVLESPKAPASGRLKSAHELLEYGIASTNSLAELYDMVMWSRRGAPTHEDQDLLRAMVVMAGATLDVVVKRIIRDTLHALVAKNSKALKTARDHVHRRLLKTIDDRGGQRLAEALLSESPHTAVIDFIIQDVTGESLQSVEELQRAVSYLGLEDLNIGQDVREALVARNQIVHEMDAIEQQKRTRASRRRRQRKKDEMRAFAKALLEVAANFCAAVDSALRRGS